MKDSKTKGILYVSAGAVGWGISGVCSQFLFTNYAIDPTWLTAARMTFSGPLLLFLAAMQKQTITEIFRTKKDRSMLLAFAIFGLLLCQFSFLAAIDASNSGTATVLQSLNVVFMALFIAIRTRTKLTRIQMLSVLLAVLGTFLIATEGNPSQMVLSPAGLFWGIVSAVSVISYTLLAQGLIKNWGNTIVTGWGMLIGGIILVLAAGLWKQFPLLDLPAILAIAVIVIIGTAFAFSLFLKGVSLIGPVKATLLGCLEPLTSTVVSAVCLHTVFSGIELLGFLCIITTVVLSIKKQ